MIEFFSEPLIYLSRNLMEMLKNINIKENLQDINQFQKTINFSSIYSNIGYPPEQVLRIF